MKSKKKFRTLSDFYIEIKTFPHFGEKAVPIMNPNSLRTRADGVVEREFIMLDCKHLQPRVWLTRADI